MRKLLVVVLFLNGILIAKSQNLTVEGTAPDLYITHTVAPKENFYSIARLYNQPPKSIASYNKIMMDKGLNVGQKVKIPLNAQNFDVSDNTTAGETLIPVTHIVGKSETLFKIAGNNATANLIRKWNNLTSDNITPGTALIIGHLKVNSSQSPVSFAKNSPSTAGDNNESVTSKQTEATQPKKAAAEVKKEETSDPVPEQKEKVQEASNQAEPQNGPQGSSANTPARDTALAVVPEGPKPADNITAQPSKEKRAKQQEALSKKTDDIKKTEQPMMEAVRADEGAFANLYDSTSQKHLNKLSGVAATFKSTSGWQDKKYYVLVSNIAPGTILKISSSDNKVVYAKVLGSMPEMKENEGLLLRINNAAASELGIIDPKFPVQISYYQ
jgi:LysM repeat protein